MNYKICSGPCGKKLPATTKYFHKLKNGKYGLRSDCKICRKDNYNKKSDYYKEKQKEYYEKNKDKIQEYQKDYYEKNSEDIKEKRRDKYNEFG